MNLTKIILLHALRNLLEGKNCVLNYFILYILVYYLGMSCKNMFGYSIVPILQNIKSELNVGTKESNPINVLYNTRVRSEDCLVIPNK